MSIPGYVSGKVTLSNGQVVPTILPELRVCIAGPSPSLSRRSLAPAPRISKSSQRTNEKTMDIENFLERVYYETRNFGLRPKSVQ